MTKRPLLLLLLPILVTLLLLFLVLPAEAGTAAPFLQVDRADNAPNLPCTVAANDCSLYSALHIANSNGDAQIDFINFAADYTIVLTAALPAITGDNIWIFAPDSQTITVDGNGHANVFSLRSDNVIIEGLTVVNAEQRAFILSGLGPATNVTIRRNVIGETPTAQVCPNNLYSGIHIEGASGPVWIYDNVIQCTGNNGIFVNSNVSLVTIGQKPNGDMAGNLVQYTGSDHVTHAAISISGNLSFAGHIVRGNRIENNNGTGLIVSNSHGVEISANGFYSNNHGVHISNALDTWLFGNVAASNRSNGIDVTGSNRTVIGCPEAGPYTSQYRNYIHSNTGNGISIENPAGLGGGKPVVILCNYIGTTSNGQGAAGNLGYGIAMRGVFDSMIGASAESGNVISANQGSGIHLGNTVRTQIIGNRIGTSADGRTPLGNQFSGIYLTDRTTEITIGGDEVANANLIGNNGSYAIHLDDVDNNDIRANYIGNWPDLLVPQPNAAGIYNHASDLTFFGLGCPALCLFISHNYNDGILIRDSEMVFVGEDTVIDHSGGHGVYLAGTVGESVIAPDALIDNEAGGIATEQPTDNVSLTPRLYEHNGFGRMPIDLLDDGMTENHPADDILDYPTISQQAGTVITGTACTSCSVNIYEAVFSQIDGSITDALRLATLPTDNAGVFSFDLADYGLTPDTVAFVAVSGDSSEMVGLMQRVPTAINLAQADTTPPAGRLLLLPLLLIATTLIATRRRNN